ncbi:hypothetical protein ACWCQP_37410 [Streptomyces chartreusis]
MEILGRSQISITMDVCTASRPCWPRRTDRSWPDRLIGTLDLLRERILKEG